MTIAIISMIRDPWGGSEELWYQMAKLALSKGSKVIHLRYEHPEIHHKLQELIQAGLISLTRPGWIPSSISNQEKFARIGINYLRKKVKDPIKQVLAYQPDIVLYNGTCYSIAKEPQLLKALKSGKISTFFVLGQLNQDLVREISDQQALNILYAYQQAKKVFFVSERNRQTAQRHLCSEISNSEVLRNPVNIINPQLLSFPQHQQAQFAFVGNLITNHKGQDLALQVLAAPKWKSRDWKLNVYGDGIDKNYLQKLVHYLQLDDRVIFHGRVNDIRSVWENNQVLLMPSLMEGMPLAVVEAMISGRVCVATDVGGSSEWIVDGANGFIAKAPTVKLIDEAMERAWQEKPNWETIGRNAHERALSLYDANCGETLLNRLTS